MKNDSPELPPVTYKEAIKLLNGLCEGLGDEFKKLYMPIRFQFYHKMALSDFLLNGRWSSIEHGADFWFSIYVMITGIESGAGIKQQQLIPTKTHTN